MNLAWSKNMQQVVEKLHCKPARAFCNHCFRLLANRALPALVVHWSLALRA